MTKINYKNTIRVDTIGWNKFGDIRGRDGEGILGRGSSIVHPVATGLSPQVMRSQAPQEMCSSTGPLEC